MMRRAASSVRDRRATDGLPPRPGDLTQAEIDFYSAQRRADIEAALKHRARRARWAWVLLIAAVIFVGFDNRHQAATSSAQNRHLIEVVQRDRARAIYDGCVALNKRNANTRAEVETRILKEAGGDLDKVDRLRARSTFVLTLIDRLAPPENCVEKRDKYVSTPTGIE